MICYSIFVEYYNTELYIRGKIKAIKPINQALRELLNISNAFCISIKFGFTFIWGSKQFLSFYPNDHSSQLMYCGFPFCRRNQQRN